MPKLSELISGGAAPATGRMRLSDVIAQQAPQFSAEDLPTVGGTWGFSDEFAKATGQSGGESFLNSIRPAAADIFGNYEDVARALQKVAPGAKVVKDAKGYEVLELPNGERFAMNKPGVQGHEVAAAVGNTLAFLPAGRAAGMATTLPGKMAVAAGASGATDAALQLTAAGKEEIDPLRLATTAAGGAVGELAAPFLGRLVGAATDKIKAMFGKGNTLAAGRELAKQLGIANPTDDQARAVAARWKEIQAGASPESVVAESEMGLKLTQGQKTGDYGALRREEMLRASDSTAGQFMRGIDDQNRQATTDYFNAARAKMAGGEPAATTGDAFDRIARLAQAEQAAQKGVVADLYGRVAEKGAKVDAASVRALPDRLRAATSAFAVDDQLTPSSARVLKIIEGKVADLPEKTSAVTIKAIETERQRINNAIGTASNPTDRKVLMTIKNEFDQWFDGLAENAVIGGDPSVIQAMKSARDARAVLGRRFEAGGKDDVGGKLVAQLLAGKKTPEELAQAALGAAQVSKVSGAQFVKKMKAALKPAEGPMNPAWGELKSAVLQKMVTNSAGEPLGPQAIVANLRSSLRNRSSMMRELYEPEELAALGRAAQTLDSVVSKGMLGRSSGTAERAFAYVEQLLKGFPGGGMLVNAMRAPGQAAAARNAYSPLRPYTDIDALIAAGGAAAGGGTR